MTKKQLAKLQPGDKLIYAGVGSPWKADQFNVAGQVARNDEKLVTIKWDDGEVTTLSIEEPDTKLLKYIKRNK